MAERLLRVEGRIDRLYVSDKDPEYYYRWCNTKDTNIMELQMDGFESVLGEDPLLQRSSLPVGQSTEVTTGLARTRGDLVLMKVRREVYEETLVAREAQARERQDASLDTMIAQQNENAREQMRRRGQKKIPDQMIFRDE